MTTISNEMKDWINEYYGIHGDGHRNLTNVAGDPIDTVEFILNGMYDFPHIFRLIENKYKKLTVKKQRSYIYLTLSPGTYIPAEKKWGGRNLSNTPENLAELKRWCERWFSKSNKFYSAVSWVVENGSKGDHLHVHAICEMITSHKHAERLKNFWKRFFPNNQLLLSGNKKGNEYDSHSFHQPEILLDKLNYFENELKGSHMNHSDLGVRGSVGALSDIILSPL